MNLLPLFGATPRIDRLDLTDLSGPTVAVHRRDAPRSWSRGRAWTRLFPCSRTREGHARLSADCATMGQPYRAKGATQGRGGQDPDRPPPADPSHIRLRSAHRPSASRGRKTFRRLAGRSGGRKLSTFSLDPEPPAARGGAECGGGQPRHPPSGECTKGRLVTGTNPEEKIPMSNDAQLTITGNLVDDPEPRYTPNGQPAVRFRIASTPRFYDKAGNRPAARPGRAAGRRAGRTSPPLISRKYVDPDLLHPAMTSSGQRRSPAPALAAIPTVPP